ncbi:hypothetical protein GCM10023145_37350 [Angustibacter luteus]|uniref:Peptidoglycan-binding protein n=2 Tax=Angustibacter luteus TaxID=658456 RepID=A0ABW1JDM4_9ACTN
MANTIEQVELGAPAQAGAQQAQGTVTLPPQSPYPYTTVFLATYTGTERLRRLFYVDQLLHYYWQNPSWTGDQLREAANGKLVQYDKYVTEGQLDPFTQIEVYAGDFLLKGLGAMAPKELSWMIDPAASLIKDAFGINDALAAEKRTNAQTQMSNIIDEYGRGDAAAQVAVAYRSCSQSAACLDALTKGLPEIRLGNDKPPDQLKDDLTAARIVQNNRETFNQYVTVNVDSGVSIKVDELRADLAARLTSLHDQVGAGFTQVLTVLGDLDRGQKEILSWIHDQARQAAAQQRAKDVADVYQGMLDAAKADLGAIVAIAGLIDPKLARAISVVGGAIITIAEASLKAVNQIANLTRIAGQAGGLIASAALCGTVVGAVVGVLSFLISMDEPNPDQMILEGIQNLQTQVAELGKRMEERFDRIDKTLNAMYQSMATSFSQVVVELGRIEGDLNQIQGELLEQAAQLHRIETAVGNYAVVVGRRDLLDAISEGIGWDTRVDVPMSLNAFLGFAGKFRTWGTVTANDEAEMGTLGRDFSADKIAGELTDVSQDRNLAYLDGCTRLAGAGPLFANNAMCGNPLTWTMAARAHAQLLVEQARLAQHLAPDRNDDLRAAGTHIRDCLRSITVEHDGTPRVAFFHALIDHYAATVKACGDDMDAAVQTSLDQAGGPKGHPAGTPAPNPWGPPGQRLLYKPPALDHMGGGLPPPPAIASHVPPELIVASWFNGAADTSLSVSCEASWFDVTPQRPGDEVSGRPEPGSVVGKPDPGREVHKWRRGVNVGIWWSGTQIAGWGTAFGTTFSTNDANPPSATETPAQAVRENWTTGLNLQAACMSGLAPTEGAQAAVDQVMTSVTDSLKTLRDNARSAAGRALGSAADVVEGARLLLDNVVTLGMPKTLATDDLLRTLLEAEPPPAGQPGEPTEPTDPADPPTPPLGNGLPGVAALVTWWGMDDTSATAPPHFAPQLVALAAAKVSVLRDRLDQHLNEPTERAADSMPPIDDAIAMLTLADFIVDGVPQIGELMPATLPLLALGSKGPAVKRLQALLLANIPGLTTAQVALDGDFGPITAKYVKQFQTAAGLAGAQGAPGDVDGTTWRCLLGMV